MQLTDAPAKLPIPFANAGAKTTIPTASQIGITPGAASLTDGFPPLTRTPIASGGVPPSGQDMNGILFEATAINRWDNAGAGYVYDSTFSTAIGGYPKGARVLRTDGEGYWLSTADNNTTDPEAGGAGWVPDYTSGAASVAMSNANVTLTSLQAGHPLILITGALTANINLVFPTYVKSWIVLNNASGAFSVTCKTSAGTGLAVATGGMAQIVGDGTNITGVVINASPSQLSGVQGTFKNLAASATGTGANVTVTADEIAVENSSNVYQTLRSVSLTIAGTSTGANGLDTGALATSTWYSLWVIWNGTTTAGLMSLSATAPTMPSGYTHKARVGWIRTDGTANKYPLSFIQFGRTVQYKVAAGSNLTAMPIMASGTAGTPATPTWASVAVGAFIPSTAGVIDIVYRAGNSTSGAVAPNNAYGNVSSTTNPPPIISTVAATTFGATFSKKMIVESSNIYWMSDGANVLACAGWDDNF